MHHPQDIRHKSYDEPNQTSSSLFIVQLVIIAAKCSLFGIVGVTDKCLEALSTTCSHTLTTLDVNGCVGIKVGCSLLVQGTRFAAFWVNLCCFFFFWICVVYYVYYFPPQRRSREDLLKLFPHLNCFKVHSWHFKGGRYTDIDEDYIFSFFEETGDYIIAAAARKDHIITPFQIFQLDCQFSLQFKSLLAVSLSWSLYDWQWNVETIFARMNERIFGRRDDEGTSFYLPEVLKHGVVTV